MNGIGEYYTAYTMSLGKGSLFDMLDKIDDKIRAKTKLNNNDLHIINTMQEQIYDLMAAQYDAGYMNLDIKLQNLLVNKDNNIQIIDSGATDFTYEVDSILENVKEDIKREILIFGQQLIVTLNTYNTISSLYNIHKLKIIPTAINKLKDLGITSQEVGDYLSTVKDDTTFSYSYMLNYYGNRNFVPTKHVCIKYMKDMINEMFNLI
jgi:serine/threonine protein kinase